MFSTYRLMSKILVDEDKKFTNEELAVKYQEKENASVLAELFCRNFPQWLKISYNSHFYNLDNADKASIVLEKLYVAIITFDIRKNIKFVTYATNIIVTELCNKSNYYKHKLRDKVTSVQFSAPVRLDDSNDICLEDVLKDDNNENLFETIDLLQSIKDCGATEREIQICEIILNNPCIKDVEIAEILKCHRHTVRVSKIALKEKLKLLYT